MIANSPAAKYLLVVKNQFSQVLSYRFEIFGNFVFRMFDFIAVATFSTRAVSAVGVATRAMLGCCFCSSVMGRFSLFSSSVCGGLLCRVLNFWECTCHTV